MREKMKPKKAGGYAAMDEAEMGKGTQGKKFAMGGIGKVRKGIITKKSGGKVK